MSQSTGVESLRTRQILSLKQILNLNQPLTNSFAVEPTWKLLILDTYGQDIISPLLKVKQLREHGVTLHLLLESKRESLPDVPAVYFVAPTQRNIDIIAEDLKRAMYDSYYLNMIYPISRPLLEDIASSAVQGGTASQIQKLTDQYVSFISLEDDLFMLKKYNEQSFTFQTINDPATDVATMEEMINFIANGLFAVCVTLGVVPIIRCTKNNAAEQVAQKLDQKIRDNLRDARNNLFAQENMRAGQLLNLQRPVLVIADRSIDLSTMMHHTWTYQALISDVLDMELNRVLVKDKNGKQKEYDMSSSDDKLWSSFKGSLFPQVAEAIQDNLTTYRKNEEEIKRLKEAMGVQNPEEEGAVFVMGDATAKLNTAINNLPELLEQKRLIDLHTHLATIILDHIKERKFDTLFETEEKLLNGQDIQLMDILRLCTNNEDILRLVLIALCTRSIDAKEKREITAFLEQKGIKASALQFVQRLKTFSSMGNLGSETDRNAETKTVSMFSKLLNHSSKFVMDGVKNLVPKKHNLPLAKMVDRLIDSRPIGTLSGMTSGALSGMTSASVASDADEFCYFDPKLLHGTSMKDVPRLRQGQQVQDVIVFVVGGGNYVEYQNIHEYGKDKGLQRITYGCTEMINPTHFVKQLSQIGEKFS